MAYRRNRIKNHCANGALLQEIVITAEVTTNRMGLQILIPGLMSFIKFKCPFFLMILLLYVIFFLSTSCFLT